MNTKPWMMLVSMMAGWINRQQQEALEYLKEENKILRDELLKATGKKRIILNDTQRRRLAILAKKRRRKTRSDSCAVPSRQTQYCYGTENLLLKNMIEVRTVVKAVVPVFQMNLGNSLLTWQKTTNTLVVKHYMAI